MSMRLHVFLPWNYAGEVNCANERSASGMHLKRVGVFRMTETEDPSASYRYDLNVADASGLTESLYLKQGWEPVCSRGKWRWYRKKQEAGKPESEYTFYGPDKLPAITAYLKDLIRPLDILRNVLLFFALVLILIPGSATNNATPRAGCIPLFLAIPVVTYAEKIRKAIGEDRRK